MPPTETCLGGPAGRGHTGPDRLVRGLGPSDSPASRLPAATPRLPAYVRTWPSRPPIGPATGERASGRHRHRGRGDAAADHAVVLAADGRAVATARLLDQGPRQPSVEPAGVIGRVAVAAAWRGRGLGRLGHRGPGRSGGGAWPAGRGTRVADFYARQGYRPIGEPDVEAGIEHVWMRRELLPGLRRARDSDAVALQDLIASAWAQYPGCVLDVDAEEPWLRAPGTAHAATAEEPARALRVITADPIGPAVMAGPAAMAGPIGGVLGSVAVWDRPATGFPAAPERAEASEWAGWAELKTLYVAACRPPPGARSGPGAPGRARGSAVGRAANAAVDRHAVHRRSPAVPAAGLYGHRPSARPVRPLGDNRNRVLRPLPPLNELPTAAGT